MQYQHDSLFHCCLMLAHRNIKCRYITSCVKIKLRSHNIVHMTVIFKKKSWLVIFKIIKFRESIYVIINKSKIKQIE